MKPRRLAFVLLLAGSARAAGEDGPPRLSLPTESDREAWRRPGFRMQLGIGYGRLVGLDGAPSGRLGPLGGILRVGARLDERWSLLGSFSYLVASERGGLSGLRYAGTLDPTWHVTDHVDLAIGLGFGGIVEGLTGRPDPEPHAGALNDSYTFPSASPPLSRCQGLGVAGLARAGWMAVLGPRSSTGVTIEIDGQWTNCVDRKGGPNGVEPDTAQPIERRQWWPHVGATVGWVIAWR